MALLTPIAPLPPQAVAQIKSSISITSLNGVIVELVMNSLDAQATRIIIEFSRDRGKCMVQDDGLGIAPAEFQPEGGLAKLHHTSKHDQSTTPTHGSNGCFLASLSALSIVTITSKHFKHHSQNSITMSRGAAIRRDIPALPEERIHARGAMSATRVLVYNLFGDMPVRVKQRGIEASDPTHNSKEWDSLKKDIAALLLFWPYQVIVTLKEVRLQVDDRQIKMASYKKRELNKPLPLSHICQILYAAGFCSSPDTSSWVDVAGATPSFELRGGICLDPAPTKNVQFISFGITPMLNDGRRNFLYEDINRLFANSLFGVDDELPELDEGEKRRRAEDRRFKTDGYTNRELKGSGKGVDRWPMFCMRIDMKEKRSDEKPRSLDDVLEDDNALASIANLIQRVVVEFLKANNFIPKHVPKQQSPRKRDRYANIVNSNEFQAQPRKTSQVSPIKKLPPASSTVLQSSSKQAGPSETSEDGAATAISRMASPFNILPRVKSGRTINVPAVLKPPYPGAEHSPSPPVPSSMSPAEALVTPRVSSHFSPPESVVSKEGKVLRLPFLDVDRLSARRKGTSRPTTSPARDLCSSSSLSEKPGSSGKGEKDEVMRYTDNRGRETFINTRTGQTVVPLKAPVTRKSEDDSDGARRFNSRVSTRLPGSLTRDEKLATDVEPRVPSPFVASVLKTYRNPVFRPTSESAIPIVANHLTEDQATHAVLHGHKHNCSRELDIEKAFSLSTGAAAAAALGRLRKDGLRGASVVRQVDKKFILITMSEDEGRVKRKVLVLVDQHAADERIRIEALMSEYFSPPHPGLIFSGIRYDEEVLKPGVKVDILPTPITFVTGASETEAFRDKQQWFAYWGVVFVVRRNTGGMVVVTALPPGIVERCRLEPKLIIDLMRRELYASLDKTTPSTVGAAAESGGDGNDWLSRLHNCPQGILDMLNSRACRSAIMFNDELSLTECEALIERLAKTKFPFMCAHGRPSMVPLVEVGGLGGYEDEKEISIGK